MNKLIDPLMICKHIGHNWTDWVQGKIDTYNESGFPLGKQMIKWRTCSNCNVGEAFNLETKEHKISYQQHRL